MTGRSCWCLELFRKGQLTARNIDVVECSRLAPAVASPEAASTAGLRCHASVPLYAGERPLGVMNLAMRGWRRLTRQELDLLTTIADQVGVAVERARLAEQSVERARHDERSRIARDVHDTLAQDFTAIGLHLEAGLSQLGPRHDARPALTMALDAARQGSKKRGARLPASDRLRSRIARSPRGSRRWRVSSRPRPACACKWTSPTVVPCRRRPNRSCFALRARR